MSSSKSGKKLRKNRFLPVKKRKDMLKTKKGFFYLSIFEI